MRVLLLLVLIGCEAESAATPPAKAPACPAAKPTPGDACKADMRCTYTSWTCDCANWVGAAGKDNHRWYCSNCFCPTCANPDAHKSCMPGDACEEHNVERDEYYRCDDKSKWTCGSSSSNNAACARVRG